LETNPASSMMMRSTAAPRSPLGLRSSPMRWISERLGKIHLDFDTFHFGRQSGGHVSSTVSKLGSRKFSRSVENSVPILMMDLGFLSAWETARVMPQWDLPNWREQSATRAGALRIGMSRGSWPVRRGGGDGGSPAVQLACGEDAIEVDLITFQVQHSWLSHVWLGPRHSGP